MDDFPYQQVSPSAYSESATSGWFRRSLPRCQPAINPSLVITNIPGPESQTNIVTAAMSPVLGYTSWKYSHHEKQLRSGHLTPCEYGERPKGRDVSTPMWICTNIRKCSPLFSLLLIRNYYIELGKHEHPSFHMQNILLFCSLLLLAGVNINTLIPLLVGSGGSRSLIIISAREIMDPMENMDIVDTRKHSVLR